ncbi:MAG: F0F1 ATP synthase subunit delta [Rhizobiaceae bacterium]
MAKSSSSISGVAERYAGSLFELSAAEKAVAAVEKDLGAFEAMLKGSADLDRLVKSPVFSADDQVKAITKLVEKARFGAMTANFLKVVARNRRLFALPAMIAAFRRLAAEARGETSAEVTSAHALSAQQEKDLKATLKGIAGKDVAIALTVDPSILGGLIVKMGSRQIDSSLETKLNSLKLALKEVG